MGKDILSLEKEVDVEKKEWPVLRIGWFLMGVFIVCGACGLLGGGALSGREIHAGPVKMKYDKLLRYSLSSEMIISAPKLNPDSSILINSDYKNKVKIEKIIPEPQSMELEGEWIRIKFNSLNSKDIIFYLSPIGRGSQKLCIKVNRQKINTSQFIFL